MAVSLWRILFSKKKTISDTDGSQKPDWSDLHPDLIRLISHKLTDISDFVCFRVVCKRWRCAVQASDLAPQLPWIMDYHWGLNRGSLRFYSILTGKTYTVNADQHSDSGYHCLMGSAYNYIPIRNWKNLQCSFFNPLTNEELSLPVVPTDSQSCVPSVQLLSDSDQSSRYVCMANNPTKRITCLFACQLGDLNWTIIEPPSYPEIGPKFLKSGFEINTGFALYNGMCYANDGETGNTTVTNLATRTVVCVVPRPETELQEYTRICLLVSSGEILRVSRYQYHKYDIEKPYYFHIYRLELGKGDENVMHPCWIKIDDINNQFLFLHEDHGCAFRTDDFPGFVGNSIYFLR
ncbi:hypothetical protein LUZ63_012138 [Rhynchospora breviuscula]|uniref:F-box domain-containing protein n=1 Tax=Rhynchospora breviuscula TaxID=2022672 RepID=A0A9Q0CK72_9POAL|nr:hypothetical protein LUZ63_012138 [Rhynchospora breviuscula]